MGDYVVRGPGSHKTPNGLPLSRRAITGLSLDAAMEEARSMSLGGAPAVVEEDLGGALRLVATFVEGIRQEEV